MREPQRVAALSDREREVLRLIADGRETEEIARELCYSARTVVGVVQDVTRRFRLRNRAHAVAFVLRTGMLDGVMDHGAEPPIPGAAVLTSRQTAVLRLMAEGHGNAAIAKALSCSEHTVKNIVYELMVRLRARNRAQAVAVGLREDLI